MLSRLTVTHEIDDLGQAADELLAGLGRDFILKENAVGIVFSYADMDLGALMSMLEERVPFELVGATSIATLESTEGFHEMSVVLLVLTADDCTFTTAASGKVGAETIRQQAQGACRDLLAGTGEIPGLVIAFLPLNYGIPTDIYTDVFDEELGDIPVIGGVSTRNIGSGELVATVHNSEVAADKLVLLGISGNVHPACVIAMPQDSTVGRKRKVTDTDGMMIRTVGGQPFADYLKGMGVPLEGADIETDYVSYPLIIEQPDEASGKSFAYPRVLLEVNTQAGTGRSMARVPEGATLSFCTYHKDDVLSSARQALAELQEKMQGGDYSTVLAISCIGRYLLSMPGASAEAGEILDGSLQGLNVCGFYSGGEVAPAPEDGSKCFLYNETLVLCAF